MINNDRIVPVTKIDLLSLYGTILNVATSNPIETLKSIDVEGNFSVTVDDNDYSYLADQPVKTLDFASGVSTGTVYFVAGYDFSSITVAGAAATLAEGSIGLDEVKKDCATLYEVILESGAITISAHTATVAE